LRLPHILRRLRLILFPSDFFGQAEPAGLYVLAGHRLNRGNAVPPIGALGLAAKFQVTAPPQPRRRMMKQIERTTGGFQLAASTLKATAFARIRTEAAQTKLTGTSDKLDAVVESVEQGQRVQDHFSDLG
jgi:hypothetical protein